jgi:hypothetical protein
MAAVLQTAPSPSPQALWMALILSTDLQMPLHDQSKDAAHTFPACFFHSQSAHTYAGEHGSTKTDTAPPQQLGQKFTSGGR